MTKRNETDRRIFLELIKNAKISDRQISKKLGISQATVTRRRKVLEKELIDGYTFVPKWEKLGYTLMVITFVKIKPAITTKEMYKHARERELKWLMPQHNILMAATSRGIGMDALIISVHKSYAGFDEWFRKVRLEMGDLVEDIESVIVNLCGTEVLRPLHFKYLSEAE